MGKRTRRLFAWICLLGGIFSVAYALNAFLALDGFVIGNGMDAAARDTKSVFLLLLIGLAAIGRSIGDFSLSSGKD